MKGMVNMIKIINAYKITCEGTSWEYVDFKEFSEKIVECRKQGIKCEACSYKIPVQVEAVVNKIILKSR